MTSASESNKTNTPRNEGERYHEQLETLLVKQSAGVVEILLDRPDTLNAISFLMREELLFIFEDCARRSDVRVVVIGGVGGAFCSGADLTEARPDEHDLFLNRQLTKVALSLHNLAMPTIAKVEGAAVGAGCNLALGCDLVVASDSARFSEIFAKRGLSVDFGGSWFLPRLVGLQRAKEIAYFGDIYSAADAAAMGLVNKVVPAAELDEFVDGWARRLASGPPIALALDKTLLNQSLSMTLEESLASEARSQAVNRASKDTTEALLAYSEKRAPVYRGR
ncbi:MAG: enoyl-CoA hydratase-related protein [Acidimicrobiales bacterium]|jgi:enoyl-CoA hydratase/carnithine racemase